MKIAFLVEHDFWEKHFGVRNYFQTIEKVLAERNTTEYITYLTIDGNISWYKLDVCFKKNNRSYSLQQTDVNAPITMEMIESFETENADEGEHIGVYYRAIGSNLKNESYDMVFITNPWVIADNIKIHAGIVYGIVHDFIPNQFALSKDKPFLNNSADQHRRGYEYYNEHCDVCLCNSAKTADEYRRYYPGLPSDKVRYLPPMLPYEYADFKYDRNTVKENAVILAAPFDPRKGIANMPDILNAACEKIDILYIYGKVRCDKEIVNSFFSALRVRKIVYYPYITYSDLMKLFAKCKVLLFPSLDEGLGIPIIESQRCGCRVLTTDARPMKDLVLEGSLLMTGDYREDGRLLGQMMCEEFDYQELSEQARITFHYREIHKLCNP